MIFSETAANTVMSQFNALWLNPNNENTFPPGLMDALTLHSNLSAGSLRPRQADPTATSISEAQRLRLQMQADALQPLHAEDDENSTSRDKATAVSPLDQYSSDILEEATQFLRLQVRASIFCIHLRTPYSPASWSPSDHSMTPAGN